ncbi:MAG: OmpH family outer membrane protein [Prevotellaceae bacterium]|jgi:outer membrane protein|nr:OmpH family outer membrane protein [Prevotellaceae bacterium]
MKHFNTIVLSVLCLAVIVLYVLHFTSRANTPAGEAVLQESSPATISPSDSFPIAYVSVDTLLMNYMFAKEMNEELLKKQEKYRNEIGQKQQKLQEDATSFQQKYESGGFLTKESFEQEQTRLMKKEQELQNLDRRLTQELFGEQQKMNTQLRDSINTFFKLYNQDKHYKVIFSDTGNDNIFYAEDYLNITSDVIEQLNARYKPAGK